MITIVNSIENITSWYYLYFLSAIVHQLTAGSQFALCLHCYCHVQYSADFIGQFAMGICGKNVVSKIHSAVYWCNFQLQSPGPATFLLTENKT